jgi:putative effector of murein hydrolase LrgA (UPF0299 family)
MRVGGAVVGIAVAIVLMRLLTVVPRWLTDAADFLMIRVRLLRR